MVAALEDPNVVEGEGIIFESCVDGPSATRQGVFFIAPFVLSHFNSLTPSENPKQNHHDGVFYYLEDVPLLGLEKQVEVKKRFE